MSNIVHKKKRFSSSRKIVLGFAATILVGALLLMLPISSKSGVVTPFNQALFTSTSAVCVTGLVLNDTGSYWSVFGQAVILLLIQIGGLGVVTVAVSLAMLSGKRISLIQRSTLQDAISAPKVGGVVRLTRFILCGTAITELIGMLLMLPVFCRDYGLKGIWMSMFHSVSAFCNAGFDILGTAEEPFVSLTGYANNPLINITVMLLIIIGGIGFFTWNDVCTNKFRFRRYSLQSKIVLSTTLILIVAPAVWYFIFDFSDMPTGDGVLGSLFQAVTPRTAGFNTYDLNKLSSSSKAIMIFLMLVGGSPSSTAGGMKTTTLAVLTLNALSTFKKKENAEIFDRRIDNSVIKNAATVFAMYCSLFFVGGVAICSIEGFSLSDCLFETASAVGTVGLTLGITPKLGIASQLILVALMFLGRVGGLTFVYATIVEKRRSGAMYPLEKITVG